ncbi:hypothetical protein [Pseudoalteromonas sp. Of7M-16]|uniref:hypothetical protein n=1 Tax=Pseudoalteromonas sp. Of7M-16 TaxID=2917756 RepID=UPI001EF67168|nr:hypothetical protein [Pseudoalteromonas sp. Of7M-16]MCG7551570.1 hypothetical protein [Pseudoalteromonas sp. Of7M-16]
MALSSMALEGLIIQKLEADGFKVSGEHAQVGVISKAIAEAVVEHVTSKAEVSVTGGSSKGSYQIK